MIVMIERGKKGCGQEAKWDGGEQMMTKYRDRWERK